MSDKQYLKGINFPGLDGTYFVPQVDETLSNSGDAADAKVVGDAVLADGDIAIVKELITGEKYQHTAYVYSDG